MLSFFLSGSWLLGILIASFFRFDLLWLLIIGVILLISSLILYRILKEQNLYKIFLCFTILNLAFFRYEATTSYFETLSLSKYNEISENQIFQGKISEVIYRDPRYIKFVLEDISIFEETKYNS